jgi:hypothetical protein
LEDGGWAGRKAFNKAKQIAPEFLSNGVARGWDEFLGPGFPLGKVKG